jgi:excisionase family DNA binding protein
VQSLPPDVADALAKLPCILTPQEVCPLLRWSLPTVYRRLDEGALNGPPGTPRRVYKASVEAFLLRPAAVKEEPTTVKEKAVFRRPRASARRGCSKSRVVLPYPPRTRSESPAESGAAQKGGCSAAG